MKKQINTKGKRLKKRVVKKLTVDFSNRYNNNIMDVDFLICASAKLPQDILESKLDGTISPIGFGCYRKQRIDYY